jgi:hypothetical protein
MLRNKGRAIQEWRRAMAGFRETGDVSQLAEAAARMEPTWRRLFIDAIIPTGLRRDLETLLRTGRVRHRTVA